MDFDFKLLGSKLKRLRENLEITQTEAAARIGVSNGHISALEAGKMENFTVTPVIKLACLYGVTVPYLMDGNQDEYKAHVEPFTIMIASVSQETARKIIKVATIIIAD